MNTTYQDMTKTQRALYQLKLTAIIMFTGERGAKGVPKQLFFFLLSSLKYSLIIAGTYGMTLLLMAYIAPDPAAVYEEFLQVIKLQGQEAMFQFAENLLYAFIEFGVLYSLLHAVWVSVNIMEKRLEAIEPGSAHAATTAV